MDKQKLLAVLKLKEDEQYRWCEKQGLFNFRKPPNEVECSCKAFLSISESLADLAFRLRNEAKPLNYHKAIMEVYRYRCKHDKKTPPQITFGHWLVEYITAIDMIIAALIAKGV